MNNLSKESHRRPQLSSLPQSTVLLLVLVLLLTFVSRVHSCPAEVCICKWKGGKQTVECGGQQLPTIPEGMDPGTQVLNFSGNSLQVLQSERFLRMDLLNLQKIFLSRNQLIRIHEKAFRGLSNLVELDLSDNSLQHVPSETFQDYSSLMRLSLSGNPIRELKTSAFRHLSFLTTLELSNCQIERIENEAFVGMDNLEWLRLDGNRISFIQGNHILPKSLHGVSLHSNRWTCDCRLLDMHAWLINYNTPLSEEPKCVEPPRLKGQIIKSLKKDELACLPEVSPKSMYNEISEGRNVSIVCLVRAIPEPRVLWLFNGEVLTNESLIDNQHMFYYIDESGSAEEKRSEIFIYNVGVEDNGTFSCVGQNIAGTTFSNYTLRVIIKEPPVVNEVSFPRDYLNYIIASTTGTGIIFVVLLCTIVIKCKQQRKPNSKRKKCSAAGGGAGGGGNGGVGVTSVTVNTNSTDGSTNDAGLMKCSSIINDTDSLNGGGGSGLLIGDGMTPTKLGKENGIIISGQMKQNLLLYAPAHFQQQQQQQQQYGVDGVTSAQALHMNVSMGNAHVTASGTPPPMSMMVGPATGGSIAYCSPPSSVRNYQEKNPDLVNDAESVKHKLKNGSSIDASDYDGASDCSGPCSIQGISTPVQYDNCYQLTPQFGSQIMRGSGVNANTSASVTSRFAAMTTLPRGMQLKTVLNNISAVGGGAGAAGGGNGAPQHQVDVHLNPICFLGQDGFAYDYSNSHMQQSPPSHHHLHLQPQHSLGATATGTASIGGQSGHQQQNFYRTLPHNRAHKQQQFAASATNPSMRYSLEAEFLQRSAAAPTYDKYVPNVRFTAEGYPQQTLVQYPSPPEGYKSSSSPAPADANASTPPTFQQWPPCLPGYHAQPVRYPSTIIGVLSPQQQQQQQQQHHHQKSMTTSTSNAQQTQPHTSTSQTQTHGGSSGNNSSSNNTGSSSSSGGGNTSGHNGIDFKKRCVGAQADNSTIPECDESDISPTTSTGTVTAAASSADASAMTEESSKLRHLNGPLADSPDEGYVGDSHEGSDI